MTDFTAYQPPGLYTEEEAGPLAGVVGITPTVVALVGPSVGYRTFTESVVLSDTDTVRLSKLGIDTDTLVVESQAGVAYTVDTDYEVTVGDGLDADDATTRDNTTDIARVGDGAITDGELVRVSYNYTDDAYFEPLRTTNFDDVRTVYGEPFDPATGAIVSPLSFAAKVALDNGANQIVLVATDGSAAVTRTDLSDAYELLTTIEDVSIVVPLPVTITGTPEANGDVVNVATDLQAHVEEASAGGAYRIGIIGHERTSTVDPADIAPAVASERVVLAYPNSMLYFNSISQQTMEVSGYYLAAALAGRLASQEEQVPLTKKLVSGFVGIPASVGRTMTFAQRNTWSDAGVCVVESDRTARLLVRHGVTTNRTTITKREISLVRAKDTMIGLISETLVRSDLIGNPIVAETPLRIKGVVEGVLQTCMTAGLIFGYDGLQARIRSLDPSVIEVRFAYKPSYPLNYIVVVFRVDTTVGDITAELALAA